MAEQNENTGNKITLQSCERGREEGASMPGSCEA